MFSSIFLVIIVVEISIIASSIIETCILSYSINKPVYNCLSSLDYYRPTTLYYLKHKQFATVSLLYDLAFIDLNQKTLNGLRQLNSYGVDEDIWNNCERCAKLSNFTIDEKIEEEIVYKLGNMENPITDKLYSKYYSNENEWRNEMCFFREQYQFMMEELNLNEKEINYLDILCGYYLSDEDCYD